MKILILDGTPHAAFHDFDKYLSNLSQALQPHHVIMHVKLRDMELLQCTGCWSCWVKTPGECIIADSSPVICRQYLEADLVLLASPVIMGFTSALLKRATERLLPLLHPHIEVANNELRHKTRYRSYPKMGLLLGQTKTGDRDDMKIIAGIYHRIAAYFSTSLVFVKLSTHPVKEIVHAVNSL